MSYPDRAIEELNRATKLPGIRGVYLGTTINDQRGPRFDNDPGTPAERTKLDRLGSPSARRRLGLDATDLHDWLGSREPRLWIGTVNFRARPQQTNFRLNGISLNGYSNSGAGSVLGGTLGVDAVQEFSVLTSNPSAEYGRTSGGLLNAITSSETNLFHGDVYEFLRNSALDAANFNQPLHQQILPPHSLRR